MSTDTTQSGYADTLNLPKTSFQLRVNFKDLDAALLQRWQEQDLYRKTFDHNHGREMFILHDGPPYANGHIHLGHAYNKILKDIVCKSERMSGKHVPLIPGWDCHGLPIELKVVQESAPLSAEALLKACRDYAQHWIETQRVEFKKLGVLADWDRPYTTMSSSYESAIVKAFGVFYAQGFIQKKLKTVPWCASCNTVLANAEIEYAERKDPSIYVLFGMQPADIVKVFPSCIGNDVSFLVWTTTPWTLPLNRAVVVHPEASYSVVLMNDRYVVVGNSLVHGLSQALGMDAQVIATVAASDLIGLQVSHPIVSTFKVPVIGDQFVSMTDGTACVHSAPGCGPEDYEVGLKNNLEIYSPISSQGCYTSEIVPAELAGMPVADGQIWVIKKLAELQTLFFKASVRHQYPHCWRCRNGLIFRATSQWFCDLSQHRLKDRALEAIEPLMMYPATGKNRFMSTLEGRLEWCLSRQRTWGVPIPALSCLDCGHVFTNSALIQDAAQGIERDGIEFWHRADMSHFASYQCPSCASSRLAKERDILDVWFESGVSHYAVLFNNPLQAFPANMYLEGKDQHRAWFQSSLLTGLVLENMAPMHEILTHGFTVDQHGKKMSKSLGNVVTPFEIIDKVGTDGLRLWVASNDCDSDPVVSELLLKNVSEVYRKIRNTSRFLLSNLYDFNAATDSVAVSDMYAIDQYALVALDMFNTKVQNAYRERRITTVFHELADYCSKDLSATFLDIVKDRLYVEKQDSLARRSAQTVCHAILQTLTTCIAPILSFTAEEIYSHYGDRQSSVHLQSFVDTSNAKQLVVGNVDSAEYLGLFSIIFAMRDHVLKQLEALRVQGTVRHSLDAHLRIHLVEGSKTALFAQELQGQSFADFIKELCIVSNVTLVDHIGPDMEQIAAGVYCYAVPADGTKCQRCWHIVSEVSAYGICDRCTSILR